jgi:hypothetical protein
MISHGLLERVQTGNLSTSEGESLVRLIFALGKLGTLRAILCRGSLYHKTREKYDFGFVDKNANLSYVKVFPSDTPEEVMDNYD